MGFEKDFPVWAIFFAILPAVGFAVLGYLDQNLTSVIVNRPSNNLQKLRRRAVDHGFIMVFHRFMMRCAVL